MAIRKLDNDDFIYEYPQGRPYIPQMRGRAKSNPIISDTDPVKVYHIPPDKRGDKEISEVYPEIDTDLARDNLENDLTAADMQDL